jgi:hypothetical protein
MRGRNLFWFLSLYAWHIAETSWRYCFNRLWSPGKYVYSVPYDSCNRTFFMVRLPLSGPDLITIEASRSHPDTNTLSRTPLDELSARRRDLYLATHNSYKKQTPMPPVGFEPAIPASEQSKSNALDRASNGIGLSHITSQQWRQRSLWSRNWHITYKLGGSQNCKELKTFSIWEEKTESRLDNSCKTKARGVTSSLRSRCSFCAWIVCRCAVWHLIFFH